jgi:hypothetical protein
MAIMLIGIVQKNAIMMINFALEAERSGNTSSLTPSSSLPPAVRQI